MMRLAIGAFALAAGLAGGITGVRAADFVETEIDGPDAVVTRRTIVERPVLLPPRRVVREVIVERPALLPPRRVIREEEVVVERRPVAREIVVERRGVYGPRPAGYGGWDPDPDE
ncbi:hypothetical protein [Methylobacterium sp. ID0610]|uniref:hypothetical protein n=1 Tax=Methylobacterium carpenticola TaxID=3344827 RepID=UPI0036C35E22